MHRSLVQDEERMRTVSGVCDLTFLYCCSKILVDQMRFLLTNQSNVKVGNIHLVFEHVILPEYWHQRASRNGVMSIRSGIRW